MQGAEGPHPRHPRSADSRRVDRNTAQSQKAKEVLGARHQGVPRRYLRGGGQVHHVTTMIISSYHIKYLYLHLYIYIHHISLPFYILIFINSIYHFYILHYYIFLYILFILLLFIQIFNFIIYN